MVNLKILVSNASVGCIIGKGGRTISEIQADTGAKVVVSRSNEFYPDAIGNKDRVVLISGDVAEIVKGLTAVLDKLQQEEGSAAVVVRLLVHMRLCGALIGKNGSTIKSLSEQGGESVSVKVGSPPVGVPGLHERVVWVESSDPDPVAQTVGAILNTLLETPQSASLMDDVVNYGSANHHHHHHHAPADNGGEMHEVHLNVPESRAGAVIGRNGHVMTGIQDLLGVTMSMSKKGEFVDGTEDQRKCTIKGHAEKAVELAERIVQLKIEGVI
ncbi:Protein BTR1 [Picochlorum sp. SENEW3]|nr:Protein BTR1 [Picochlorum sp. SENEW3]